MLLEKIALEKEKARVRSEHDELHWIKNLVAQVGVRTRTGFGALLGNGREHHESMSKRIILGFLLAGQVCRLSQVDAPLLAAAPQHRSPWAAASR